MLTKRVADLEARMMRRTQRRDRMNEELAAAEAAYDE